VCPRVNSSARQLGASQPVTGQPNVSTVLTLCCDLQVFKSDGSDVFEEKLGVATP